jgi:hypothetical protein
MTLLEEELERAEERLKVATEKMEVIIIVVLFCIIPFIDYRKPPPTATNPNGRHKWSLLLERKKNDSTSASV